MKLTPSVFYSPHKGSYAVFVLNIYSSVCTYDCTVDRTALLYIFTKCQEYLFSWRYFGATLDGNEKLNSEWQMCSLLKEVIIIFVWFCG